MIVVATISFVLGVATTAALAWFACKIGDAFGSSERESGDEMLTDEYLAGYSAGFDAGQSEHAAPLAECEGRR